MEAQALEHERRLATAQGGEALKHAIAAAELYMQAAGKAEIPEDRKRFRRKFAELISLGERLKANNEGSRTAAVAAPRLPTPESTRPLTTAEKTIVLRASRLHGNIFRPWESAPGLEKAPDGQIPVYNDPSPFSLSLEQQAIFAGWRRPAELPGAKNGDNEEECLAPLMEAQADMDLAQDLATDCSVVASLCAAARLLGPTQDSLLGSLMIPFDHEKKRPAISQSGQYIFRMYFNGCWRSVSIDDRLPASKTDRTLFVVDRRNPRLIWPALMEKAYLKIRGGYDFPGSNSGTDLHALTGWIPEQIFLQSDDIELDEIWNRVKKSYDNGNAILTLGTGNILPEEEKVLGLVKEHDYAVVDLKQEDGSRLLRIKNPWVDSLIWTGVGSSATLKTHTVGSTSDESPNQFWMAFEDVLQHFDSLYVNWNPALFSHREDHHFKWDMCDKTEELVYTHNPQYSISSPSDNPIWVLLSRHWQDGELDILRQRKAEKDRGSDSLATVSKQLGFTALALYTTPQPGTRVPLLDSSRRQAQTPYVDSPNTLLRYTPTPHTPQTLVVTQTELPLVTYSFTLSFFSLNPLTITPAQHRHAFNIPLTGAWTRRTAGGSASHPSYFTNPQYSLTLTSPSAVSLVLSTSSRDIPVHVALVFSPPLTTTNYPSQQQSHQPQHQPPRRVTSLSGRDILCSSTEYHLGCTSASSPVLDPGTYTIMLSTYEPGQLAPYTLLVSTDCAGTTIKPIPSDGAGRLRTLLPPLPPNPSHQQYSQPTGPTRLRARLYPSRLIRLNLLATQSPTHNNNRHITAARISLDLGTGPHRTLLTTSHDGEFADAVMGLRTREVDVDGPEAERRGGLWVVWEEIGRGGGEGGGGSSLGLGGAESGGTAGGGGNGVQIEVLSDGEVDVGGWERAEED
ncbi:uncharacterized protein C8A04DRAFT_35183 [Dichotomopilus funicola]|uniref:Calpain catalytic domain-containing protein n=1 Tax=Dichotomopilus funicola TaxID=1934379 RepID=A0AAN6ZQE3_9PEZI|nr:hypothetical protein C8A04DRAFT_35183 [Dichotomopilus funicola]